MHLSVDLHSHSGASGGVGDIRLDQVAETMARKGIQVFGTGDALHEGWLAHLERELDAAEPGLYRLPAAPAARFLIQTEIIVTAPAGGGRKGVHTVLLLPSLAAARAVAGRLDEWGVKRTIGRPFLTCASIDEVAERLHAVQATDPGIEIIPAHVLTPQGIYGSDRPVDRLADVFGAAAELVRVVETGLSADPAVLALIPELDARTLLSNSDGHSGALHRVGREYTTLEVPAASYAEIIGALRAGRVVRTAEFTPAEGRYFLTGHRAGKGGHGEDAYCYFSPDRVPAGNLCPLCGKELTVGVLQRALHLSAAQGEPRTLDAVSARQPCVHMIPLVEVIAAGLGIKNPAAKKVLACYEAIIAAAGSETAFWAMDETDALRALEMAQRPAVSRAVLQVRSGEYTFRPLGYDGVYGELALGETTGWFGHCEIHGTPAAGGRQGRLDLATP
jgi:PHP family Zn ribbon phosphoesterase